MVSGGHHVSSVVASSAKKIGDPYGSDLFSWNVQERIRRGTRARTYTIHR